MSFQPIVQCLARAIRHTSTGMESMQKQSSPPSISRAIRSRMRWQSGAVDLRRSLYCLRDRRRGISRRYPSSLENNRDSLSMPRASVAKPRATTFRSENLGTTPERGTFPFSLAQSPAFCFKCPEILRILHVSCAYGRCKSDDWTPLIYKIPIICTTFFSINLLCLLIPPTGKSLI